MKVSSNSPWVPSVEIEMNKKLKGSMAGGWYKPKGRDRLRVWVKWKGQRIDINKYFDGTPLFHEIQCVRVLERIRSEIDQGIFDLATYGRDRPQIFQNAWKTYQAEANAKQPRIDNREMIFKYYLLPYFKDMALKDIGEHHIKDWFSKLPKNLNLSYRQLILKVLIAFSNQFDVMRRKRLKFPSVSVPRKVPLWLSPSEQDRIISCIQEHHKPIFRFLQTYGCRVSEACNLKRTDIDWEKNIIIFKERKNEKENDVPLFDEMKPLLKPGKVSHREYIFCTKNGMRYRRGILLRIWKNACKKAEMKSIPLKNGTRHSKVCQLLAEGKSTAFIARFIGITPSQIERAYGTITVETIRKEMKKVGEVIKINFQNNV